MNSRFWHRMLTIVAVLTLTAGIGTLAQEKEQVPNHFTGVINDYTPISGTTAWEVRGPWSLRLNKDTAEFSAAFTMEMSPVGQSTSTVQTVALTQHTHNITMEGATITYNPTDCPLPIATVPIPRIEVKGMATVTANGGPFPTTSPTPVPSELQVCIDGGTSVGTVVAYSNITLAFGAPASGHFGSQAIHGVVRKADWSD